MAIQDFFLGVQIAASLQTPRVQTDSSRLKPDQIQRTLRRACLWLTPATMQGFDPRDFTFLPKAEQVELQNGVEAFLRIAEQVPGNGPCTPQQQESAAKELQRVVKILRPDFNPDVEAFRMTKALELVRRLLPEEVVEVKHEFNTDWTGDEAVWIWVIMRDESADESDSFEKSKDIQEQIEVALRRTGAKRWPYVHFRTESEEQSVVAGTLR